MIILILFMCCQVASTDHECTDSGVCRPPLLLVCRGAAARDAPGATKSQREDGSGPDRSRPAPAQGKIVGGSLDRARVRLCTDHRRSVPWPVREQAGFLRHLQHSREGMWQVIKESGDRYRAMLVQLLAPYLTHFEATRARASHSFRLPISGRRAGACCAEQSRPAAAG